MIFKTKTLALTTFLLCLTNNSYLLADSKNKYLEIPEAYIGLNSDAYHLLELKQTKSNQLSFELDTEVIKIALDSNKSKQGSQFIQQNLSNGHITATKGINSLFGQMHLKDRHYVLTTNQSGIWAIALPKSGLHYNSCGVNHENQVKTNRLNLKKLNSHKQKTAGTIIDVLMLYDQAIANRYPGELLQTRVDQYFNVSNQTYANSGIDLAIRQVGLEQVGYNFNDANITARNLLQQTLESGLNIQGFENVSQLRNQTGADLVIFLRTHDIETRGNCGIAFFPVGSSNNLNDSYGVNVMADGMSSWSVCTDQLMVHEIGHNLSAGHHNWNPVEFGYPAEAKGFAKLGQYGTVMGSFGTGTPDRFLELNYFSNPNIQCGGGPCGIPGAADNATVINQFKGAVANYKRSISTEPLPGEFVLALTDLDHDGVLDRDDEFPHNIMETRDSDGDGLGDAQDIFPNNRAEQIDTDQDGIGNNADNDDDGDGVLDFNDAFPLNPYEFQDSDLDGIGDLADDFVFEASEYSDSDEDGIGNHADFDDDNDGVIDVDEMKEDLLVISTGNNRILRFDAQNGLAKGIEVLPSEGLLTFQSDLAVDSRTQTLFYTTASSIRRRDLLNRDEPSQLVVPAYSDTQVELGTGFPTALALDASSASLVVAKLRQTVVDRYHYGNISNIGQSSLGNLGSAEQENIIDFYYKDGISTGNNDIYALGQNNRIYRANVNIFTQPSQFEFEKVGIGNASWLVDPYAFVNYSNGSENILIHTDQSRNKLIMSNGDTGTFVGIFADLQTLGYSNPTGIVLTNDGRLLVAVADQNAILAFDVSSQEFLGVLVQGLGLDQPHKMALTQQLLDRFHQDDKKVVRPNAGNWFNPESSGRGFNVGIFNNRLQVLWFTYDDAGLPVWYQSAGLLEGFGYTAELLKTKQINDNSIEFEAIGTLRIEFKNERQATYYWTIGSDSGSEEIEWFQFSAEPEIENYTGMWTRSDAPGWGVAIATVGEVSVSIPFAYDSEGEPRWSISNPTTGLQPLQHNMFTVFSNTLCPTCSGTPISESIASGTMNIRLSEDPNWSSAIQWADPLLGDWSLDQTPIIRISSPPTRPR